MSNSPKEQKQEPEMPSIAGDADSYRTPAREVASFARLFPSLSFYSKGMAVIARSASLAKRGGYGDYEWYRSSLDVIDAFESVGVRMELTGLENLRALDEPSVIVGNHMSMLETFALPGIIRPYLPLTFVVKDSLLTTPVFKHVMCSRNPVAVTRTNPRKDFATVMKEGQKRLEAGASIVVFPQTTRTTTFDPESFNSIGYKLARRAKVPLVPVAVLTDAWSNGKLLKDIGKIDITKTVRFAFGKPIDVQKCGPDATAEVVRFIQEKLIEWRK